MDKTIICKECHSSFEDEGKFHKHLKAHKMSMAAYYQKFYPRYDKFTGEIIKFKNKEFYFLADFNDRANLKKWLDTIPQKSVKDYITALLLNRKIRKHLIYAPCQIELRTLLIPGIKYIKDNFGDYFTFCEEIGFKNRYSQYELKDAPINISRRKIFVDTREKTPLTFKLKTISEALKFGDYALKDGTGKGDCYIERKSLGDFFGTLSNGYERFRREIDRSAAAGAYLIVIVESDIASVHRYPYQPHLRGKVRVSPEYVFRNMRSIIQDYNNVQFLFVKNRTEASRVIERLFASTDEYKKVDLQYALDIGNL